jgi:Protein of unknown function (DUF2721)
MEITFNTPALLFPAISLLLLAYTNRYLALANLIRKLHDEYIRGEKNHLLLKQIRILRQRINLVRYMQGLGVFSFLCCVVTMYGVYQQWQTLTEYVFALSLLSLLASLAISLIEISKSTQALELELSDMEELEKSNFFTDLWTAKDEKQPPPDLPR